MKIVQIVTQMEAGGAQRAAYLLHNGFLSRGHQSELWFLYLKRPAYVGKHGVRVLTPRRPPYWVNFLLYIKLVCWIRTYKPDAVITHTHYANILGQLAAAVAGVRCRVAVQHSILARYPTLVRYADWLFGTVGLYTAQVAVSRAVVQSMSRYPQSYRKNVSTIYNGIPLDFVNVHPLPDISGDHPTILHVGRLSHEKNHGMLFRTLQRLPEACLVLAGNGELREALEQEVRAMGLADRVRFLGEIPPEQVRAFMAGCDLFMFPSAREAMPMALLEAMAAGMAIVASDIPANREALQDGGLLVPPDPQELFKAARYLLNDTSSARKLGRKAAERAMNFSVDTMLNGYERLLMPEIPAQNPPCHRTPANHCDVQSLKRTHPT